MQSDNINYELYRINQNLKGSALTQEEIKNWIYSSIAILKIGIIKSFNAQEQEGIVFIPEYDGLEIKTRNISNIRLNLDKQDTVILLQSSINIFNTKDNNYFDKNYFYILSDANLNTKKLGLASSSISISSKRPIEFKTDDASLREAFVAVVDALREVTNSLANLRIIGQAEIEPTFRIYVERVNSQISQITATVARLLK
ncbi:hypothetical protein DB313_06210 (plasmid) [Borrelia turcica IST7]|uniref:Uncharacterized protein n=1 Tax=Borrelia turcica IST7 TaxID=1104446 RepID=A0A386PQW2_9SPIR|nr:DUF777 family protein [Borrelia turcica]AYE37093.1 hypothetical protein DB313_06210 [Borrelia turcica IST7]